MAVKPKRAVKDNVFRNLFSRSEYLLQLYQSLHPEDTETTEDDLGNVTLETMLVGNEYNDLGFTVKDRLIILVEAQSTWTENIVIRSLFYLTSTLKEYFMQRKASLYSTAKVKFPKPELYVIYTGEKEDCPDTVSIRRDYFPGEYCCIEAEAKIIRQDASNKITSQYIGFCKVFNSCIKKYGWTQKAIQETLKICKDRDLLKKYLEDHEAEVIEMMTLLFDENYVTEAYENEIRQNALNEGRAKGRAEGREEGIEIGELRGREEGRAGTYFSLARRNLISKAVAADEMGISVAELEKKLQESSF